MIVNKIKVEVLVKITFHTKSIFYKMSVCSAGEKSNQSISTKHLPTEPVEMYGKLVLFVVLKHGSNDLGEMWVGHSL